MDGILLFFAHDGRQADVQDVGYAKDASCSWRQTAWSQRSTFPCSNRGYEGKLPTHSFWTKLTCQKAMPPEMMKKLRAAGPGGAQKMMQEMMGGGGAPGAGAPGGMDIGSMMKSMMGGGGGGGGMPNMAQMQGKFNSFRWEVMADDDRSYESYGRRRRWWNAWLVQLAYELIKLTRQI